MLPIKVLHSVVNMNRGGAETLLMNIYRHIDRSKVQFDFLTCLPGVFDEEITSLGGTIHRIPYISEVGHWGYMRALNGFFATHPEYTVVHSHMNQMSGFVLLAAMHNRINVRIAHSHSTRSSGNIFSRSYKWYAGTLISHAATHHMACSQAAAQWLFPSAQDVLIVKNGIDISQYMQPPEARNRVRDELSIARSAFVIGHIGSFGVVKNHRFLLDIFAHVRQLQQNAMLVLVGDGALFQDIQQQARKLGLADAVRFLGVRDDVPDLLQSFDVLALPSHYEGLPLVIIEAQAAGVPCIISSAVTREVDLDMGITSFLPIDKTQNWADALFGDFPQPTINERETALLRQGYDIRITTEMLEHFYEQTIAEGAR